MKVNLRQEKKLWKKGHKYVIGLDESGRGCLSGPVVAAAVMIKEKKLKIKDKKQKLIIKELLGKVKDSKKLSSKKKKEFYKIITKSSFIEWGIGRVSEKKIDKVNILRATKLAMEKAVNNLKSKNKKIKTSFLILDGNFKINSSLPQKPIIKADEKVLSCCLASILAKVDRDRIMVGYHKKYPQYGFERHKGYSTRLHLARLKKYGSCKIHRMSFKPIAK